MTNFLVRPRFSDSELDRKAYLIYRLILGTAFLTTVAELIMYIVMPQEYRRWATIALVVYALSALLLFLNNKGKVRYVSAAYIIFSNLLILGMAWTSGGIKSPSAQFFSGGVLLAGLALGRKEGLYSALLAVLVGFILVYADLTGFLPASSVNHQSLSIWVTTVFCISLVALLQFIFVGSLDKAVSDVKESEILFRGLFEKAPDGIIYLSRDLKVVEVNEAYARLHGYSVKEMKSLKLQDLDVEILSEEIIAERNKRITGGENLKFDVKHYHRDGHIIEFEVSAYLLSLKNNDLIVAYHRDITLQKRAQKALRRSEETFRAHIENSFDVIFSLNSAGEFLFISPSWDRHFGFSSGEVLGKPFASFVHPDDIAPLAEYLKRVIDLGYGETSPPYRVKHAGGNWLLFVANGNVTTDSNGEKYFIGVAHDITEQKRMEQTLRENEKQFRMLYENSPIGIYRTTYEGKIILANDTLVSMLGYSSFDDLSRRNLENDGFEPSYERSKFIEEMEQKSEVIGLEADWLSKSGNVVYIRESAKAVRDEEGKILYFDGTVEDITERRMAENQIKRTNEELKKINLVKDKFFSIIAHDLKSPFQGLLGITGMMAEDLNAFSRAESADLIKKVHSSLQNLMKLTENLLDWARIQQGFISYDPEEFSILDAFSHNISLLVKNAEKKDIKVLRAEQADLYIKADKKMFNSILGNLLSNAIKFTARGGMITVNAGESENNMVLISIKDSGVGISADLAAKLFLLEEKTGRKGTEGEGSTGLGLMLCKEFVEKHGGRIRVESEEGKGSTFYFTIPQASPGKNIMEEVIS